MNVTVCVKQIPDPALPGELDPSTNTLKRDGKLILDESDSYGVEMALQLVDAKRVNTPANWPYNELVGDKVIVPPNVALSPEDIERDGVTVLSDWFRYKES